LYIHTKMARISWKFGLLMMMIVLVGSCSGQLSNENFYSKKCPNVFKAIRSVLRSAVAKEPRMAASLLRLHFHDCFVN
ncbi:hypothetical protein S245_023552, partial [Arachis hypogaea]